jgi:two-component system sensor histidine kinase KdpD
MDWQSLEEILGSALKWLGTALKNRPLRLDVPPDLPLVKCDAILIERVLVNLLDNAARYTLPGTMIGVNALANGSELRVEVWDEGPGLPPGQEAAIFEQFERGEKESTVPGVGLGLAICKAIVAAHDGRIWAENRTPRGARFRFTLPLDEQPDLENEPERQTPEDSQ